MRILFVLSSLGTGGTERSLAEMLPFFRKASLVPTIAVFRPRPDGVEASVREQGFDVRLLSGQDPLARVLELRRMVRSVGPALVHTSLYAADIIGRMASAALVPVLTSIVNQSYDPSRLLDPNVRRHRLLAARLVDCVTARGFTAHFHAVTESVKSAAVRDLGLAPRSITVIERGRARERLGEPSPERRSSVRRRLGVADDAFVYLNVGRREHQKNQVTLVRAFRRVLEQKPTSELVIVGRNGNASRDLDAAIRAEDLGSRVRLLDHRDDVPDLLAASDCFVFPSLFEGMGGAAVEALGLSVPVITTPTMVGVVEPDVTALVVPVGEVTALADAMLRLAGDAALVERLAAAGRASFERRFRLDQAAARMLALYERVATVRPAPRVRNVELSLEGA